MQVVISDVARPLSYKTKTTNFFKTKTGQAKTNTKTTFSRPRPLLLKTIKFPRPLAQPEILIERGPNWKHFCDGILVTFFGDVMMMTS